MRVIRTFQACDGTNFTDQDKCLAYEADLEEEKGRRLKNILYFRIQFAPHEDKTSGFTRWMLVAIEELGLIGAEYLCRSCLSENPEEWNIRETSADDWMDTIHDISTDSQISIGSFTGRFFISPRPLHGFPQPLVPTISFDKAAWLDQANLDGENGKEETDIREDRAEEGNDEDLRTFSPQAAQKIRAYRRVREQFSPKK